ncbi:MAG: DNA polymerase III subunit alpha, partial [Christiangramia sp.]
LNHSAKRSGQAVLFKPPHRDFELPEFEFSRISEAYDQMELLGFPLCSHFELLKEPPESALLAKDLKKHIGKEVKIYGNLVNYKKNPTSNGKYMFFGTFYDQQGGIFDIVLFPQVARHYDYFNYGIYACYGTVTEDLGHLCIDIKWLKRQATHTDPRLVNSSHKVKLPA